MADPIRCEACQIELQGCGCDGAIDDGCFHCEPTTHVRPECPPSCPGFREKIAGMVRGDAKLQMSAQALASIAALSGPKERTESEMAFDEIVRKVKLMDGEHAQKPMSKEHEEHLKNAKGMEGQRLYTVTTLAASPRFGGTRTVAVCSSFERAREMIEQNHGDIYEGGSYRLAVIEAVASDWLYYILDEQYWYVWDGDPDNGDYKPIERPEAYESCVSFGIG